VVIRGP